MYQLKKNKLESLLRISPNAYVLCHSSGSGEGAHPTPQASHLSCLKCGKSMLMDRPAGSESRKWQVCLRGNQRLGLY